MNPYQRVLCPIDFSDVSRVALRWSLRFATEIGAELSVLHVVDTSWASIGNLVGVPDAMGELRQRAEEEIAGWRKELDLSKVRVDIVEGVPADVVVDASKKGSADLMVMGTHGVSGFQRLFLGSVTEKVLHRARVPLLTIAPVAGDDVVRPERILMAVDFGGESESVVRHGVWLAEHYRATLIAAHVVPIPYVVLNDRTLERLGPAEMERLEKTLTAERKRELKALVPDSLGVDLEVRVTVGQPYESLLDLVHSLPASLVILGAGGHGPSSLGWLGSTCHRMARSAPCPVLVVR